MRDFLQDPKSRFGFSPRSFGNLPEGMRSVFALSGKTPQKPDVPILLMSGSEDVCGNFGKGVQKACDRLRLQGHKNVKLRITKGSNGVFNEIRKEEVFKDLFAWLDSQ